MTVLVKTHVYSVPAPSQNLKAWHGYTMIQFLVYQGRSQIILYLEQYDLLLHKWNIAPCDILKKAEKSKSTVYLLSIYSQ
jgi:hypothetical protein